MSKTVDQRVVEMRFDNTHFEKNVSQTMSTLDKFKAKLNFKDSAKGLENLGAAAKKVDMRDLGSSVETVRAKFSALDIVGVTALANITNSAINAGKNIVRALTIDPVRTGWSEYELKMGSIQTIMASTGESLESVNGYLNELNEYSDKTIYSFSDMTQNIGKFTNAGVKLEDAVLAIKGIANEAALSGANANEASRAMYNFAQALSAGYVKLIDWKSIELANMATVGFKEQLIETAVAMGTLNDAGDGMYETLSGTLVSATHNFNDSLKDEWMTTEVLVSVLRDYADETTDIGKKATQAATEVKTFSQMLDALKESAQSGWAQTWEIIFGDFNEGKTLWTNINKVVDGLLGKLNEARNKFLKFNLGSSWEQIAEEVEGAGIEIDTFKESLLATAKKHGKVTDKMLEDEKAFDKALKEGLIDKNIFIETLEGMAGANKETSESQEDLTEKLKYFQKVVDEVWNGDYKNGEQRIEALTEAGYNYAEVQELVNKTVDGHRLTLDDLSESQMKSLGYTDEQIAAINKLKEEAKGADTTLGRLLERMNKPSGRELLLDTFKRLYENFSGIVSAFKKGWESILPEKTSDILYRIIENVNKLVESFGELDPETAANFEKIGAGLAAIYDITKRGISASFTTGIKLLKAVLSLFNLDLLDVIATLADYIVAFRNWLDEHTFALNPITKIAEIIKVLIDGITKCIKAFLNLDSISSIIDRIAGVLGKFFGGLEKGVNGININWFIKQLENAFTKLESFIKSLDNNETFQNFLRIGEDVIRGFVEGIKSEAGNLLTKAYEIFQPFIDKVKAIFDEHSPSKVFYAIGAFVIIGLLNGLSDTSSTLFTGMRDIATHLFDIFGDVVKNGIPFVVDLFKTLGSKILEGFQNGDIDLSKIIVSGTIIGVLLLAKKLTDVLETFAKPFGKLGGLFNTLEESIKSLSGSVDKYIKAQVWRTRAEALKSMAIAIAILAGSLIALSYIDWQDLLKAGIAIGGLVGALVILMNTANKMDKLEDFNALKITGVLMSLGAAMILMSFAMKIVSGIDFWSAVGSITAMTVMVGLMAGLMYVMGEFVKGKAAQNIDKAGAMMWRMAIAIGIMAVVMKLVGGLSTDEIVTGLMVIGGITAMMMLMTVVAKYGGKDMDKAGSMLWKMAVAVGIMAVVMRMFSGMETGEIIKALSIITWIGLVFAGVIAVSQFAGRSASKAGTMLLKMSIAIGILAGAMKMLGSLTTGEIMAGLYVLGFVEEMFIKFIAIAWLADDNADKAGNMILKMSIAIGIMAIVVKMVAGIPTEDIIRGAIVIGAFEALIAAIIFVSDKAGDNADKAGTMLLKMSAAILIIAGAIALLSLLNPDDVYRGTACIGALMGMMALMVFATKDSKDVTKLVMNMAIAIGVMAGAIGLLALIPDQSKVATAAASIGAVMAMFALMVNSTKNATKAMPLILTITAAVAILGGVLYLLAGLPVESTLATSAGLSMLLLSIAASLTIISKAAPMIEMAVPALALMIGAVGMLAIILGLLTKFDCAPSLETALALSVLLLALSGACVILAGVGPVAEFAILGALALDGVILAIGALVVGIGALMQKFPTLDKFLDTGIGTLKKLSTGLGEVLGGFVKGFTTEITSSLPVMGTHLGEFMTNAQPFIDGAKQIDSGVATGIASLAGAILALTAADILDALTSWATGGNSLVGFGEQLAEFGPYMAKFAESIVGVNPETITASANAAKALAEMADAIPNEGGIVSWFAGENNLATFGVNLVMFGSSLKAYSMSIAGIDTEAISASVTAGEELAGMAEMIPNLGGVVSWFTGDNDLATFGLNLVSFGTSLQTYALTVTGLNTEAITNSVTAATELSKLQSSLDKMGGVVSWFAGKNDLATFGQKLASFGSSLSTYGAYINTIDVGNLGAATNEFNRLADLAKSVESIDFDQMKKFGSALKKVAEDGVSKFITAFEEAHSKVKKAAKELVDKAKEGVEDKQDSVNKAFEKLASKAASAMKTQDNYDKFKGVGEYLAKGFAKGMETKESKQRVTAAATSMAYAAKLAAEEAAGVESPSKVFYGIGKFVVAGFVNALHDGTSQVYNTSAAMADSATNGFESAIYKLSNAIDLDIDPNPTIRPVLDLTDVKAGSAAIDGMFAANPTVGIMSNVRAINNAMNQRNQNGGNKDVVSAIKDLKDGLTTRSGDTYNLNGLTYQEGTEVADAISVLARAVKMEGRM